MPAVCRETPGFLHHSRHPPAAARLRPSASAAPDGTAETAGGRSHRRIVGSMLANLVGLLSLVVGTYVWATIVVRPLVSAVQQF